MAALPSRRTLAWDCGTGNGQAALDLAERFEKVVATDASQQQIEHAAPHPRVEYRQAPAESSGIESGAVDLVTVAQAVHWFDFDRFYAEVERVLAPGGALAVWTYNLARVSPEVDALVDRLAHETLRQYWPRERRWVDEEYRTLPFPFAEVAAPPFWIEESWDLRRLHDYIGTWSATVRYFQLTGRDPRSAVWQEMEEAWGDPGQPRTLRWPIAIRAGYPRR